jgi:hypothetical protein
MRQSENMHDLAARLHRDGLELQTVIDGILEKLPVSDTQSASDYAKAHGWAPLRKPSR